MLATVGSPCTTHAPTSAPSEKVVKNTLYKRRKREGVIAGAMADRSNTESRRSQPEHFVYLDAWPVIGFGVS